MNRAARRTNRHAVWRGLRVGGYEAEIKCRDTCMHVATQNPGSGVETTWRVGAEDAHEITQVFAAALHPDV